MQENMMVGGEGRHFDRQAAAARYMAALTEALRGVFDNALARGVDVPLADGSDRPAHLSDLLTAAAYDDDAARLLEACSLVVNGKYDASSKALLAFVAGIGKRFSESAAERLTEGDS